MSFLFFLSLLVVIPLILSDKFFRRSDSLKLVFVSSPYVAGLLLYFFSCTNILDASKKVKIKKHSLVFLSIFIICVICHYFFVEVNARTIIQSIQFFLIVGALSVAFFSDHTFITNPAAVIRNLQFAVICLCLLKVTTFLLLKDDFSIFGPNEDSFIIIFVGFISSFLRDKQNFFIRIMFLTLMLFTVILYESRASVAIGMYNLIIYSSFYFLRFRLMKSVILGVVVFTIVFFIFIVFLNGQSTIVDLFDVSRNHSNIERVSMHIFAFEYLLSNSNIYGLGNIGLAMQDIKFAGVISEDYPHPHSSYLRFALELGWVGLAGVVLFYLLCIIKMGSLYQKDNKLGCVYLIMLSNLVVFSLVDCLYYSFFRASCVVIILCLFNSFRINKSNSS